MMRRGGSLTPPWASRTGDVITRRRPVLGEGLLSAWVRYPSAAVAILLLSACADNPPPIVSADTSCERFAHISANDAQRKVFADNWDVMESYADSVIAHNIEYDKHCLPEAKP